MSLDRRSFVAQAAAAAATIAASPAAGLADPAPPPIGSDDPLGVRADFPIVAERNYLNSAYITPVPRQVLATGRDFLESKALRPIQVGEMLAKLGEVRGRFARLVNATPDEVAFLFATSEGENVVANALDLQRDDNVVIDELHYESEFVLYRELEAARGIELRIARHREGAVTASDLEPLVNRRTRLVSVAWVSHQNGFRHDMRPIADLAHAHGALLYTDAAQAVGMFPIDVRASGVDALCCGTYKWVLGGFGVAPFYVRREVLDRIRPDRHGWMHVQRPLPDHRFELYRSARKFEYATLPFCEVYMLGEGLAYLERVGVERIEAHTVALARALHDGLTKQGFRMFTPPGNGSSIVTFFFTGEPVRVKAAFEAAKVDVTVRDALRQVRVSPALFNTQEEVGRFLDVTKQLA